MPHCRPTSSKEQNTNPNGSGFNIRSFSSAPSRLQRFSRWEQWNTIISSHTADGAPRTPAGKINHFPIGINNAVHYHYYLTSGRGERQHGGNTNLSVSNLTSVGTSAAVHMVHRQGVWVYRAHSYETLLLQRHGLLISNGCVLSPNGAWREWNRETVKR